jgi:hypothetical protein
MSLPCGVPLADAEALAFGSARRALNEEMNSMTCGESPSRFVKCSAASFLERVEPYSSTCWSSDSGSGSSLDSWAMDMLPSDKIVVIVFHAYESLFEQ